MNATIEQVELIDITTPSDVVEALGNARAKLKEAKTRVEFLEDLLKLGDLDEIESEHFRVVISRNVEVKSTNWSKVANPFNPSRQLLTAHTSTKTVDKLRISALKKEA